MTPQVPKQFQHVTPISVMCLHLVADNAQTSFLENVKEDGEQLYSILRSSLVSLRRWRSSLGVHLSL